MSTPYSKIFSSFIGKLEDDIYANMNPGDIEADMVVLLNSAIPEFEYPKVDISNKNDETKEFTDNLSVDAIDILGSLMVLEWITRQTLSLNLVKQKLSDKDFRLTSQAAHLQALLELKRETAQDIERLKTRYSYRDSNKPNFSGLSGSD